MLELISTPLKVERFIVLIVLHVAGFIGGSILSSIATNSQQRDGIYLIGNFLATSIMAVITYLINEGKPDKNSTTLGADIASIVVLSYLLMFTVTVIQFRAIDAKISFQILFRILLATTFDLSVTYSLFQLFNERFVEGNTLSVATPAGVLGLER